MVTSSKGCHQREGDRPVAARIASQQRHARRALARSFIARGPRDLARLGGWFGQTRLQEWKRRPEDCRKRTNVRGITRLV